MTARDIFGLIVRVIGLGLIVFGVFYLFPVATILLGLPFPSRFSASANALAAAFFLILGAIFILGAKPITRVVYGRER